MELGNWANKGHGKGRGKIGEEIDDRRTYGSDRYTGSALLIF